MNTRRSVLLLILILITACTKTTIMKPDLDAAIQAHFDAINNRDIETFKAHLTRGKTLFTIVQNGHAFTTPEETISIHEQWFKDKNWSWEGSVIHKVVGEDVAMALVKYKYRNKPTNTPIETWLTYVFEMQDGHWRIVHDHNTALDFPAFARMSDDDAK